MLYLISNYIDSNPHRKEKSILELLRFEKTDKFLHEMTIKEVNAETANWTPVSRETAVKTKSKISQYLKWLSDQNVSVAFNAKDIVLPLKETVSAEIYSTKDIYHYYELLEMSINRMVTRDGTSFSGRYLLMTKAAGILAFYGLSDDQILSLDLSDISNEGVAGYNLPLTQRDIDTLLAYKRLERYDNNKTLKGTKYIRTVTPDVLPNTLFLNATFKFIKVEDEYKYLLTALKTSQLNLFGKFDRVYREEKSRGEDIASTRQIPQWFADIFNVSKNWLTKMKKEYLEYRKKRDALEVSVNKKENEAIVQRIAELQSEIEEKTLKIEELKAQLQ